MIKINNEEIKKAVYALCKDACICLRADIYEKLFALYENAEGEEKEVLKLILKNAKLAYEKQKPLCQDTGQVIVFIEIGNNVFIEGDLIENSVNEAVAKSYTENYFRKSTVCNAVFNRSNTNNNTPAIIYIKQIPGSEINIGVLIKGAGSENKSKLEMMLPTASREEIIDKCSDLILEAGENSCPPMFAGIGIGATADKAFLSSKEVFLKNDFSVDELKLADDIKRKVLKKAPTAFSTSYLADVKIKTLPTHIACLPVAVTINCHSDRISSCTVTENKTVFHHKKPDFRTFTDENRDIKEINTNNIKELKSLTRGENVLLNGEIFIARDAAHKKLHELMLSNKELPFDLKDKIIFFAGPCPSRPGEVIGSVGPTTSSRMDKFAKDFYNAGIVTTIGKGSRSEETGKIIMSAGGKYMTVTGGIAALLSEKISKCEIIAFPELGPEAVYKIEVDKFPVKVII